MATQNSPAVIDHGAIRSLFDYLDSSPTPFHAVDEAARRLRDAGFAQLHETEEWREVSGDCFVVRNGLLLAWRCRAGDPPVGGLRLVGAHTDSPNLRLKPKPDRGFAGYRQVGVEVYGGALWNSWLDRDLGVAGRLIVDDPDAPHGLSTHLVHLDRPVLRIPQLAIHLDRGVNDEGLKLNAEQHLRPIWGIGGDGDCRITDVVAQHAGLDPASVVAADLMCADVARAALLGGGEELVSSARIDNLLSCWAGLDALLASGSAPDTASALVLFDNEEVGSTSAAGAGGSALAGLVERLLGGLGADRAEMYSTLARSWCISVDGAHATHPNYPDRHDTNHPVVPNQGPVLKHNANVRYATDALSAARFERLCEEAGVPIQEFVMRADMACGSTIGPLTAAALGIPTVDVGVAQLAMHSARELCGAADPQLMRIALRAFFDS